MQKTDGLHMKQWLLAVLALVSAVGIQAQKKTFTQQHINIVVPAHAAPRVQFGAERLAAGLQKAGYPASILQQDKVPAGKPAIIVGTVNDALVKSVNDRTVANNLPGKEGFYIHAAGNKQILVAGYDYSGALYGCLELADRIKHRQQLPDTIAFADHPEMVLRGACVGIQKPTYLPGRTVYEYPYTPQTFPWLYDKQRWLQYLDSMVDNRMNSLYLWNGHPFASLVKLKEYPYAVEVDDSTFKKNEELYRFLTREADKRGIWVIQMFYNIIVSKPFAEYHHIKTQDRNRPITPLIADYTRKSIAAFVEKYPNVGLLITLGEAMEGVGQDDIDWFTKTIIPGVQDGLKALGRQEEPPIVLRAHDTDAPEVMKYAKPLYKNLYTMAKYNGEALTTYTPRGPWAELHRKLSRIGTVQIENVHILANLEPFRYGSADFIQRCVQAMHQVYEANGLHVYPQAAYWDWPYSADKTDPRLLQVDRDWIWYKEWARYAWNCHRNRQDEINYWSSLLAARFGCSLQSGKDILEAYEQSGEIAPKLLRRFGITDGNRQTLTLGMLMTQLVNPYRYGLFTLLYNSEGPEGEMLTEYAEKAWRKEKHTGETPVQVMEEVKAAGAKAVAAIERAAASVHRNKEEFVRLTNDMRCYAALANNFAEKAAAALCVLRYKYSNDIHDLDTAQTHLAKSLDWYWQLAALTSNTYLYANSMQTQQRKIPVGGNDGKFKTWIEMVPVYEQELANFKRNIDSLKALNGAAGVKKQLVLKNAAVKILNDSIAYYPIATGKEVFTDTATYIKDFAEELKALQALKLSKYQQVKEGTVLHFTSEKPVKLLVGYFDSKDPSFLQPPQLETDASANDYGQAETKIAHALVISGMPPVNVHSFSFKAGSNSLVLGKGACLLLGFVEDSQAIPVRDAGLTSSGIKRELDWLFE